jgi:hypothetical protein
MMEWKKIMKDLREHLLLPYPTWSYMFMPASKNGWARLLILRASDYQ